MFSEEKYVPQLQIELASMLVKIIISSLLCHNDTIYKEWLKCFTNFKGEHLQGQIELRTVFKG